MFNDSTIKDTNISIEINPNKHKVNLIKKEFKKCNNSCPYFLNDKGISGIHCMCADIVDAPHETWCYMELYHKK